MKKIGITGESGFIGTVLRETLRLTDAVHIPFQREFFGDRNAMCGFVSQCDAVVHLAAVSRSQDPQAMYETNMRLTACLADAAEQSRNKPHIYFGSTTHEAKDTLYHASKRDGRRLLETSGANTATRSQHFLCRIVSAPMGVLSGILSFRLSASCVPPEKSRKGFPMIPWS